MKTSRVQHKISPHLNTLIYLTIFSIAIGLLFFLVIGWCYMKYLQPVSNQSDWGLLGGFTSLISLALVAGGLTFAGYEYISKENAKTREEAKLSYDIYKAISDKLTAPEQEAARRWILQNIEAWKDGEDIAAWYQKTQAKIMECQPGDGKSLPDGHAAVKLTLNCFDYIGFVAEHYWNIDNDSLDWISPPIAKVWKLLGPYVAQVREVKGASDYYVSADKFGKQCIEWRVNNGLPDEKIVPSGQV
jgi:hypothetical protein